jgi:epoxide hydrolase-like predicted phosphatase
VTSKNNIKAVFFDFGGVLLQHMDGVDHKALEALHELPDRTLFDCVYRESRYRDHQVGACTQAEWVESVIGALASRFGQTRAEEIWSAFEQAERPLNADMMALVKRLRANRYKVGIISNTTPGMRARLKERYPDFPPLFDDIVGSGDIKLAKPDPAIWHYAMERLGVQPEESVFTDDTKAYAEAATELGMHGFHFTGYDQFAADLKAIGVEA